MSKIWLNPINDEIIGSVEVPRGWIGIFSLLLKKFNLDYHGFPNYAYRRECAGYATSTDKFIINPYYDSDCTCGTDEREGDDFTPLCEHDANCDLVKPHFLYKPTGFRINWYKYPMRGAFMFPEITQEKFARIILDCIT